MAQLLGASRQRVNQELKGFERDGAVRIEPTRLVVLSQGQAAGDRRSLSGAPARSRVAAPMRPPIRTMTMLEANTGTKPVAEQHAFDVARARALSRSAPRRASPAR